MNEFDFIKSLQLGKQNSHTSIGDDAVLINNMLISKDIMVEGVHFLATTPTELVIRKLFSSNVSDIASMGGVAKACLIGVAIPSGYDIEAISKSIIKYCNHYNLELIGGDTTSSTSGLMLSMTVIGEPSSNILTRSGANVGDVVFVSRMLGASKMALENELGATKHDVADNKHLMLDAEVRLGELLGNIPNVTACTDISDGLGVDANNIATSSSVKIVIDADKLQDASVSMIDYAISSGEEYALLFTAEASMAYELQNYVFNVLSKDIYAIGIVEKGTGVYLSTNSKLVDISKKGYEHNL